jgi:uncharacterized protein
MKILTRQVSAEGLELKESFAVEFIEMARTDMLKFLGPFATKGRVTRVRDEIVVNVTASSRYTSFCARCLEELERDWNAQFTLAFNIKEHPEFIEADEEIRQEFIMHLPVQVLCREDCKGLCIDCGANLNKQACPHQRAVPNS